MALSSVFSMSLKTPPGVQTDRITRPPARLLKDVEHVLAQTPGVHEETLETHGVGRKAQPTEDVSEYATAHAR